MLPFASHNLGLDWHGSGLGIDSGDLGLDLDFSLGLGTNSLD